MRILRDLISPTLSSFRGLKPHHDTRDDAVNIFMSAPISANMEAAERSPMNNTGKIIGIVDSFWNKTDYFFVVLLSVEET